MRSATSSERVRIPVDSPQRTRDVTASVSIDVGGPPFRLTDVPVVDG